MLTFLYLATYPALVGHHSHLSPPMVSKVTPPKVVPQTTTLSPPAQADQVSQPETLTLYSLAWFLCVKEKQSTSQLLKIIVRYSFSVIFKCNLFDELCSSRVQGATGYYSTLHKSWRWLNSKRQYKHSHRCWARCPVSSDHCSWWFIGGSRLQYSPVPLRVGFSMGSGL